MKVTEFNRKLTQMQKGKKVNIADTAEQTRNMKKLILEHQGVNIYSIIARMDEDEVLNYDY